MSGIVFINNVRQFLFEDDNFLPRNPQKAKEKVDHFCDELKRLNIEGLRLHMQCRPDSVTTYIIERLKDCGLCDLFIGIENINQKDMDFFWTQFRCRSTFKGNERIGECRFFM